MDYSCLQLEYYYPQLEVNAWPKAQHPKEEKDQYMN